ncbi:hypothetical protein ACFFIX_24040 [Metabacillus herbersteinensis]|uniref:DUF4179 domain-containing protein n=1 Tax=Metabacillus herbersteinensis TaxID=283816 RepID=A0ABV6GL71_9BACI
MSCASYKDQILKFDLLSQKEQDHLLDHIETCDECQHAFDHYLTLEEALDAVLQDETIDLFTLRKQSRRQTWQRALLVCASLLLLTVGAWYTPPVKAVIEKTLNLILADTFTEMTEPLDQEEDSETIKIIYGEEMNLDGELTKIYISGQEIRQEYENGNFSVSNPKLSGRYYKEENIFHIITNDQPVPYSIEYFRKMDPSRIENLGEKEYLNRTADVYLIDESESRDSFIELWFDTETKLLVREIQIINNQRIERSELMKFEVIDIKRDHTLFDLTPPKGARVLDRST